MKEFLDEYYQEDYQDENGIHIDTPSGNNVTISKGFISSDGIMSFSFSQNGIEKATVKSSPGVLFWLTNKTLWDYAQEPESDISISPNWCLYSPETASCVSAEPNFEQKITTTPINTVTIFLGDDFIPESIEQPEDFLCTLYLTRAVRSYMSSRWDELTEEEMQRLITANLTYKLLNGEIYTYGPPPRECPYVELILLD